MGCDIHIVIQKKDHTGRWVEIPYQDAPRSWLENPPAPIPGIAIAPEDFDSRNYNLFGILANVRNGSGFAGIKTGDGWPSIGPDRGLPADFNPITVKPDPSWNDNDGPRWLGEHSHTWIGLEELQAFPWDTTHTTLRGVVTGAVYDALTPGAKPTRYCGGASGPDVVTYSPQAYAEAKAEGRLSADPYVQVTWEESARSATYDWPGKVIPWLEELAEGMPLRLVIGFDS